MGSGSLEFSNRFFKIFLRLYPAAFKERFSSEMAQVFRSLSKEIYEDSGGTGLLRLWIDVLLDGIWAVSVQWWLSISRRRADHLETNPMEQPDGSRPLSPAQAIVAALPFLLFGACVFLQKYPILHPWNYDRMTIWGQLFTDPFLLFNWFMLIVLVAGLVSGVPRWTYSYLAWGILFAWMYNDRVFSGYGYSLKVPFMSILLGVFLLPILIKRSLQPLRDLITGLREDLTLPSLGLYVLFGFAFMIYDENHHAYLALFILSTSLAITLGSWGYFRANTPLRRELALLGGLLLAVIIYTINMSTWDYRAYYGFPQNSQSALTGTMTFLGVIAILFIGNGLLARWRDRWVSQSGF